MALDLPTLQEMQQRRPRAQPKDLARAVVKVKKDTEAERRAKAFRAAVWKRAKGLCEECGVRCLKTTEMDLRRGEVDHIRPRSLAKSKKYDPQNGRLLCLKHHLERHGARVKAAK